MTFIRKILSYFTPVQPIPAPNKGYSYPAQPGRKRRKNES